MVSLKIIFYFLRQNFNILGCCLLRSVVSKFLINYIFFNQINYFQVMGYVVRLVNYMSMSLLLYFYVVK